jgi:UDP-glucose 4-epimerase
MLERILMDYRHAYQVQYAILRYFNASGAATDGSIGEDHNPETHLIPLILDAVTGERPHITIYGDDYDTPDGTCIRDYIHVEDLALAHTAALRYLLQNNASLICNLGTGTGYSVREVIHAVEKVTKKKVPIEIGSRRSGDPDKLVADPSHAEKILGWKAGYQHIDDIVHTAWKWKTGNKKGKYSN